ncbi:DUF4093 domain-containing protein [Spiroplasma endosymbiont of Polydrusus pterygomalis]|uniref:DUF4093 domain-containing protein n=1 Tax=Spiroplasma endosymbiont of Polydrusus pterygomalis TaxID=3139327 RepID=UPI003CCB1BFD
MISFTKQTGDILCWNDYINLVDSKSKRDKIINYYNLMPINNKTTFKWLNYMNINNQDLINILEEK